MALRIKTKPAGARLETAAEKRVRKADLLAAAQTADVESAERRAGLDEQTLSPEKHRALFLDVAAAEDRAKRLRTMAADLDAEIAEAERCEADARIMSKSDELRREAVAIAKLVLDLYRRAREFALDCGRVLDFLRRLHAHNQHLREVGQIKTWNGEATVTSRRLGFDDVALPRDAEAAVIEGFLADLFIPAVGARGASLFRGSRHRLNNGIGG